MIEFNKLAKEIYEGNKLRGFDVKNDNMGQVLMLIVSELSEALEADRLNHHADYVGYEDALEYESHGLSQKERFINSFSVNIKNSFEDKIANTLIRILDLCGGLDIDIEKHVELKLKYNATREYKHGKAY